MSVLVVISVGDVSVTVSSCSCAERSEARRGELRRIEWVSLVEDVDILSAQPFREDPSRECSSSSRLRSLRSLTCSCPPSPPSNNSNSASAFFSKPFVSQFSVSEAMREIEDCSKTFVLRRALPSEPNELSGIMLV